MLRSAPAAILFVAFSSAMAFSLDTRALSDNPAPRPQDVARLAEMRQVHAAFQWLQSHETDLRKLQIDVTKIPAPPFGEGRRAEWVRERFKEFGLYDIEIDKVGNVIGVSRGAKQKLPLVALTAHIDTVFPADTPLDIKTDGNKLVGPGIGDNAAGLTGLFAIASALKASGVKHTAGILFVANVGEEGEGDLRGMRYLFESKWGDRIGSTVVLDGAGVDSVVTEALGSRRFEVTVVGSGGRHLGGFG